MFADNGPLYTSVDIPSKTVASTYIFFYNTGYVYTAILINLI